MNKIFFLPRLVLIFSAIFAYVVATIFSLAIAFFSSPYQWENVWSPMLTSVRNTFKNFV